MESLAYKEELRAHRRGHPGLPLQCLWSSIMTTTAPLLGPWTQTTRCLLCQSFVTTACRLWCVTREDGTASRRALTGPVGSAGRQCPKVERGQSVQHRRHLFHPHHRPLALTLTFPLLSFSFLSLCSFLSSFFHLHHLHVWANTVTDAELLTSYKTVLAGLQFNHCSSGSKGQTVGGQWAAEGSILIISLNETGHH